jgi:flagellar biosynthesis protein FlhF
MMDVAHGFCQLGVDRVIFTKLDEAVGAGVILNVVRKLNLQLSYLTTGQDVPDDIEVGHRRRIAELVMAGTEGLSSGKSASPTPVRVDQVVA